MKKYNLRHVIIFALGAVLSACSDDTPGRSDPSPADDAVNLSEEEMANSYIVTEPGYYKFTADNQFNLGEGLPVPPAISPEGAKLVWQSEIGSIASVELIQPENGGLPQILFEVAEPKGNALIAAVNATGKILWSWHIWMPEQEVKSITTSTGYEIMNMNLGAMNNVPGDPVSYGMLYQWGRKDPFPASPTLTGTTSTVGAPLYDIYGNSVAISNSDWQSVSDNTIQYSISHPTVCLSNNAQYSTSRDWLRASASSDALWGNPNGDQMDRTAGTYPNKGVKTCYDPSPPGWRVPPADVFRDFTSTGGYAWTMDDFNVSDINGDGTVSIDDYEFGWHFMVNPTTPLYFPAAARYDGSYAMLMGSVSGIWGNYWSNSPYSSMTGGAYCPLSFQVKDMYGNQMITVSPAAASSRADAFSIRCIRD